MCTTETNTLKWQKWEEKKKQKKWNAQRAIVLAFWETAISLAAFGYSKCFLCFFSKRSLFMCSCCLFSSVSISRRFLFNWGNKQNSVQLFVCLNGIFFPRSFQVIITISFSHLLTLPLSLCQWRNFSSVRVSVLIFFFNLKLWRKENDSTLWINYYFRNKI